MCYGKFGRSHFFEKMTPISVGVFKIKRIGGVFVAYKAIYRKWRPLVFEDVVGQGHVTKTLKNQILNDRISHAYLFCGKGRRGNCPLLPES